MGRICPLDTGSTHSCYPEGGRSQFWPTRGDGRVQVKWLSPRGLTPLCLRQGQGQARPSAHRAPHRGWILGSREGERQGPHRTPETKGHLQAQRARDNISLGTRHFQRAYINIQGSLNILRASPRPPFGEALSSPQVKCHCSVS